MSKLHEYPVSVQWNGGREGAGSVTADRTGIRNELRVPPEFGGQDPAGTNPEELLASAVAACYSITFGIIAANRKLPLAGLDVKAVGLVEEQGPNIVYRKVTIHPNVRLTPDATDEHVKMAEEMAHKADGYCIITNAVRDKVEIVVEPTVARA